MEELERQISKFRTKQILIELDNKLVKGGEMLNWRIHPFYFEIVLKTKKKDEDIVKIHYPYKSEFYDDFDFPELYLDYRIDTLNKKALFDFKPEEVEGIFKTHKFFNKIVTIKVVGHI